MTEKTEKVENFTSERLEAILAQLSTDQMRFVIARQEYSTDKEAAEAIGITPRTVYGWPGEVKEAVRLMTMDGLIMAAYIRRRNLAKAMMVKVAGLDEDDAGLRQRVATEIIEWEMGKPTQRQEHSGPGGKAIEIDDARAEYHSRALSTLADALGSLLAQRGGGGGSDMDAAEHAAMDGGTEPGR